MSHWKQNIVSAHDAIPLNPDHFTPEEMEAERAKHRMLLERYYRLQGQDPETGVPTRARMEALGLAAEGTRLHDGGPYPEWQGPPLWPLDSYPRGGRRA